MTSQKDLFGNIVKEVKAKARKKPQLPTDCKYLLVAVSGGRSSAMMARHIQTNERYKDYEKLYVFCNTGQEKPQTIQFLKDMVKYWDLPLVLLEGVYSLVPGVGVKHKIVDFENLDMKSTPLKGAMMQMNKKKWTGVFNQAVPYCSEYTKSRVSHSFAKEIFGTTKYIKAIGYRKEDMPKRITIAELTEDNTTIAPLITDFDEVVGLRQLSDFWKKQPFRLNLNPKFGNCELCHKVDEPLLIKRLKDGVRQDTIDFYRDGEEMYGNMFFRKHKSIDDLIALAASGEAISMLQDYSGPVDGSDGCVCKF